MHLDLSYMQGGSSPAHLTMLQLAKAGPGAPASRQGNGTGNRQRMPGPLHHSAASEKRPRSAISKEKGTEIEKLVGSASCAIQLSNNLRKWLLECLV